MDGIVMTRMIDALKRKEASSYKDKKAPMGLGRRSSLDVGDILPVDKSFDGTGDKIKAQEVPKSKDKEIEKVNGKGKGKENQDGEQENVSTVRCDKLRESIHTLYG